MIRQYTNYLACTFIYLILASFSTKAQTGKVYPIDEAYKDSTFLSFRMHLLEAVTVRDTSFLYTVLPDGILTSFGGDGGKREFKEFWKPENIESELLQVLGRVVSGGGFMVMIHSVLPTTQRPFLPATSIHLNMA